MTKLPVPFGGYKSNLKPRKVTSKVANVLRQRNIVLEILCDLCGMVKWSLQRLSGLQLGDKTWVTVFNILAVQWELPMSTKSWPIMLKHSAKSIILSLSEYIYILCLTSCRLTYISHRFFSPKKRVPRFSPGWFEWMWFGFQYAKAILGEAGFVKRVWVD